MKALKSPLAKKLLADPESKAQLRSFLIGKSAQNQSGTIVIKVPGQSKQVSPKLVAKAS